MTRKHGNGSSPPRQKWKERLWRGSWLLRWCLLAFVLLVSLTFFLHFREVETEFLEVGTRAPHYVISQADFSFPDQEATQALRQEAVRDIGTIYQVDEPQVSRYRRSLEESLIEHQDWRRELPQSTFDEMYELLDQMEGLLLQAHFTDERSLKKMDSSHIPHAGFFLLPSAFTQNKTTLLPETVWTHIQQVLSENADQEEAVGYIVAAFSHQSWLLQPDIALQHSIQKEIKQGILDRSTRVEAGVQIIKKGEKVEPRHIVMLQAMHTAIASGRNLWTLPALLSSALVALFLIVISILFLHFYSRSLLLSFRKVVLLVVIILISLAFAKGIEHILLVQMNNWMEVVRSPLVMPFAALLVCVLLGREMAVFCSLFLLVIFAVGLAVDCMPFLLMNLSAVVMTILFTRGLHRRREVFSICAKVLLSLIPMMIAFNFLEYQTLGVNLVVDFVSAGAVLGITAVLVIILLPLLESGFGIMTDMALMEYMDPDHELLRRMSLEAPGTYQHSLVVGHIAESAARAIGSNGLFCRAATLYHDIGKLLNPHYFTENQLGGFNIHQLLTPIESTQVIISHISGGEALARKHSLPESFIDVIREHHGTSLVYYFYCKQVEALGGDVSRVSEKAFRYLGPKPRSKESAIIMVADTVEAASRSMDEVTEAAVIEMVDKLVAKKAEDGQFDDCELTFEELGRVKKAIVKALLATCHLRFKYPNQ
jgi:putative nucleotidyltransferase with HDIG domain